MHGSVRSIPCPLFLHTYLLLLWCLSRCLSRRVAELEQENARLLALTQSGTSVPAPQATELVSEVEQLKAQLAAAEERERTLSAQLASTARDTPVKLEAPDSQFSLSSPSRSNVSSAHKSGASLGLMVSLIIAFLFF